MIRFGRAFYKMSGSGNDFVFIDARTEPAGDLAEPRIVAAICARATGVGADGIVFMESSAAADIRIRYLNRDGSLAELCGNATLCGARLAAELGDVRREGFSIETDSGVLAARVVGDRPEIELAAARDVRPDAQEIELVGGEQRLGRAVVGVPHLVVLCADVDQADVTSRGQELRSHSSLPTGANVNFLAPGGDGWRIRTYERGVEAETLACGTGAAASALMLWAWGMSGREVRLRTRSGCVLEVGVPARGTGDRSDDRLTLRGEARIVFRGHLGELPRAANALDGLEATSR